MRERAPFNAGDLADLDEQLLSRAARVVALEDVVTGERAANVIGLRHDCDNRQSLATAVKMAAWEADHGYRSSYFLLHTAPYWTAPHFERMVDRIAGYGHEIGLHNNALAESFRTGEDPFVILERALGRLRALGHEVTGTAGHGDRVCNYDAAPGEPWFANDELFTECLRTRVGAIEVGGPDRLLHRGDVSRRLTKRSMTEFGLNYEALWCGLPFHFRLSDSGGVWTGQGFDATASTFALQADVAAAAENKDEPAQLHLLVHPDWWHRAFQPALVPA